MSRVASSSIRGMALAYALVVLSLTAASLSTAAGVFAERPTSGCPVTVVSPATRPPMSVPASFNYGNAKIAVALFPTSGKLVAGRLPSGGSRATINPDGSIYAKYGWWRAGSAKPVISGSLWTDPRRHLQASVPGGYGSGFQATGLTFPTTGCWRVTGRVGRTALHFTVLVSKSRLGP